MPIDRPGILRNAEKLLRQGKLEQAIAEYRRIVDDQPGDWNTANVLGDLYVRAGQTDRAVEQFARIADHLHAEGFLPKAAAVYKKILKLKPDHEHAMLQAGEIAGRQGLAADARALLNTIADRRRARGDERGVAEIAVRLATLDPNDFDARMDGARTRIALTDVAGALAEFKAVAAYMHEKNRPEEALQALQEASALDPEDAAVRAQLLDTYLGRGDLARAREYASTAGQLVSIAERFEAAGQASDALAALREAATRDPAAAGGDPRLLLTAAERQLRDGNRAEALAMLERLLQGDPDRREDVARLGWSTAESNAALGLDVVQLSVDAALAQGDHGAAAAALQEFVTRVPSHIPALVRLIEVCAAGGLEATLSSSRVQLVDAYLADGRGDEARALAEDLVAREPWERANVERFRRVLVLTGEADPDEIIAQRLSGEAPFTSTDEAAASDITAVPVAVASENREAAPAAAETPAAAVAAAGAAFDLEQAFEAVAVAPTGPPRGAQTEVDLNVALDALTNPAAETPKPVEVAASSARNASLRHSSDGEYGKAVALYEAGRVEEAIALLQGAWTAPRQRFLAASLLARIHRDRGALPQAIEWFERAAQAPAPTPEEGHVLLFDLAEALEREGETARALAICMELQADAGNYRDVAARIDRLANVRARG